MFLGISEMRDFYRLYAQSVRAARKSIGRPLTYTEKILFSHSEGDVSKIERGKSTIALTIDRIAMQDATAQMALLQFMLTGRVRVAVPTTIHCDHLIRAYTGAKADLEIAEYENSEVYILLKSAANKYGIGFWRPGSGIIHQIVLENYAFPGGIMLGTDSHTPNAGGLGMVAVGVGGAEAVNVMAGEKWKVRMPKLIGIKLAGKLNGWASPKDIILKVVETLTVKGGTGFIIEYFGDGVESISATGRATITNMGAEVGATASIFPFDSRSESYLKATNREAVAEVANFVAEELMADREIWEMPERYFDQLIEINLADLEPQIVGPYTPDLGRDVSMLGTEAKANNWPVGLKYALIGSCTNSSYQDMERAASIAMQAAKKGIMTKCGFMVTPGSEQIFKTMQRDGHLETFQKIGGIVLANACGPCIGQWKRTDVNTGEKNSIITSYNRNFKGRNDENPETCAFIGSPEIVTAMALAGRLDFNPMEDFLEGPSGERVKLNPPSGVELPPNGFVFDASGYEAPSGKGDVIINPKSERLAFLALFSEWDKERDFRDMFVLFKAKDKCTTDHISPAGRWLAVRGHLDRISDNMFLGATNAFGGLLGKGKNIFTGEVSELSKIARYYKSQGRGWVVIGDENYGEGSSREHAAMEPRYLGCRAVIAKSFARIHETNLKQQGILPLVFADKEDYYKVMEDDRITIADMDIQESKPVGIVVRHSGGAEETIQTVHTFTKEQIEWFEAGSALNKIRKKNNH